MNYYDNDDGINAILHMEANKYSRKARNVYIYAPDCIKLDMHDDFEKDYKFSEADFMAKYKDVVYRANFKKKH